MHERGAKAMRVNIHFWNISEALGCGYLNTVAGWVSKRGNKRFV